MARPPSADSILRKAKKDKQKFEPKTPIADEMYLPNVSAVEDYNRTRNIFWSIPDNQTGLTGNKTGTFNLETTGTGVFEGLNPYNSGTADLGSVGFRWRSLFLSADATIGGDANIAGAVNLGNYEIKEASNKLQVKNTDAERTIFNIAPIAGQEGRLQIDSLVVLSADNDLTMIKAIQGGTKDWHLFGDSADGSTANFRVYGYPTGEDLDYLQIKAVSGAMQITAQDGEIDFDNDNIKTIGTVIGGGGKCQMTLIGGYATKLTNNTGANSIKGEVVRTDPSNDDAVALAGPAEVHPIGVFLDDGVTDGSEAWIVMYGIADVKADSAGFTRGDRVITSLTGATLSRATTSNSPSTAVHFQEIGHVLETAAANALGRCILHFN